MNKKLLLAVPAFFLLLLSGCATNVSTLEPDLSAFPGKSDPAAIKTAYIKSVVDARVFNDNAPQAYMPTWSNDGTQEEARAVGRKRNTFGKAMGGIVFPENMPATSVVKTTLTQALIDNGYRVIETEAEVTPETKVIDVRMNQFWSWMNPGFWQLTLTCDIKTDVTQKNAEPLILEGEYHEGFQAATESNWLTVINQAIRNFYEDAKAKLK